MEAIMNKKKIIISVIVCILIISGIIITVVSSNNQSLIETPESNFNNNKNNIIIEVKGEVYKPGIYIVLEGSRVNDIISLCGGFTNNAVTENINLARVVNDGELININSKNEKETDNIKININTASIEQLMSLSGIGETKAKAIINYRTEEKKFTVIEDIMNVSGISSVLFEKIKDFITVQDIIK